MSQWWSGRRVSPGKFLAASVVFILIAFMFVRFVPSGG